MKLRVFCLFLILITAFIQPVAAQVQSYPIKKIGNTEYYVYTVEVREGFYALFRKFGISQEDVVKHNPEAKDGLKVGQQVLIPVPGSKQEENNNGFVTHTVEKQQTLYAISRLYNVSQEDIKKANPQIGSDNNVRNGDILKIPVAGAASNVSNIVQTQTTRVEQPKDNTSKTVTDYITHTIRPKETIYAISRHYNVFVEDIINLNPLLESTLRTGEILKIPIKSAYATTGKDKSVLEIDELFASSVKEKTVSIAFLLPFMLNAPKDPTVVRFSDFYAGALIAINDAKNAGISMEIYTYDTEKSEQKIQEVLQHPELKNVDFIIGPAYTSQVAAVSEFARQNKIHTLIPFTSRILDIETNPYLFQFNPGTDTEISFVTNLLLNKYRNANVIFVQPDSIDTSDNGFVWADALQSELIRQGRAFASVEWKNANTYEMEGKLRRDKKNLIIFKTDKFAAFEPYLSALTIFNIKYDITLFSQYSWSAQSVNLKKAIISPFSEDMNNSAVTDFQKKFSRFFDWEVSTTKPRYDLLGYDLTGCFIQLLNQNKSEITDVKMSFSYSRGIQSQFMFERKNTNTGFVNQHIYLTEEE